MITEIWQQVPGMPKVEASSLGRIKYDGQIRGQHKRNTGRYYLSVRVGNKSFLVHRLVCMAFHGEPPSEKHEVLHLDYQQSNNIPSNLKWGTHAENMAMDRGNNHAHKGEQNPNVKVTEEMVREIRAAYDSKTSKNWGRRTLSRKYGISEMQCNRIAMRKSGGWTHVE